MNEYYEDTMRYEDTACYEDIIYLHHHVSKTHPPMDRMERAAQFAPFAALTGLEAAIEETARLTEEKAELDEDSRALLDEQLRRIQEQIENHPRIEVCYFQLDERKSGGAYLTVSGRVKKIDVAAQTVVFMDGMTIAVQDIYGMKEGYDMEDN